MYFSICNVGRWASGVAVVIAVCLAGCNRSSTGGVSVQGNVSFRGSPLDKAALTFFPTAGRPIAVSVAQGTYSTELTPGDYVAVVDVPIELPPGFKEGDPVPAAKVVLPVQYTSRAKSPLKATVSSDSREPINFELK